VLKLLISIRMLAPFQRFLIGLQAVVHRMQQLGHSLVTDGVALALEFLRQTTHTLARPTKRRFWIAASGRIHQPVEILQQAGVLVGGSFSPRTLPPDSR